VTRLIYRPEPRRPKPGLQPQVMPLREGGLVESHLSVAPREGIDFFGGRNEAFEIRIDDALQVTWETRKTNCRCAGHRFQPSMPNVTTIAAYFVQPPWTLR
jgi:hypothetical protein